MKSLIIDWGCIESKIAYLEDNKLVDLWIERNDEKIIGNIYRGKVTKVLKGMEAAFVDIGLHKSGYLPLKNEEIKQGQDILVQVKKEGEKDKGPKLTTEISLPGRSLVLVCNKDHLGISNKIECEDEKKRLLDIASEIKPNGKGIIIRTQAIDVKKEELQNDLKNLLKMYENIEKEYKLGIGSKLLFKDIDISLKTIRDNLAQDIEEIIINDYKKYGEIKSLAKSINVSFTSKIKYFDDVVDIFDYYGIQSQIQRALNRKVWLKSGGYIIIDKTEALTVIDVNTGKFTGSLGLDETIFKTNCEAAVEIARQLRLRDISGIIIIDFIDMKSKEHKDKLLKMLSRHLRDDKTRTNVLGITNLGLVEVVRKKTRNSIDSHFKMECSVCSGEGKIRSISSILDNIEKEVRRIREHTVMESVIFEVSENVYELINKDNLNDINKISNYYGIDINIRKCDKIKAGDIKVVLKGC
ncbi:Rne/Rng family ribonuclease [Alkalithermobacter paradoxus]|uniref:Ribonuclease G n=1 Tax=Alkalithermobacter paradoxus TaxID=29349 RepID=A0A1V4I6D7_9FIRM|nr:ribonuclease G [[Clostridium] thermoalcaliphilum]